MNSFVVHLSVKVLAIRQVSIVNASFRAKTPSPPPKTQRLLETTFSRLIDPTTRHAGTKERYPQNAKLSRQKSARARRSAQPIDTNYGSKHTSPSQDCPDITDRDRRAQSKCAPES